MFALAGVEVDAGDRCGRKIKGYLGKITGNQDRTAKKGLAEAGCKGKTPVVFLCPPSGEAFWICPEICPEEKPRVCTAVAVGIFCGFAAEPLAAAANGKKQHQRNGKLCDSVFTGRWLGAGAFWLPVSDPERGDCDIPGTGGEEAGEMKAARRRIKIS